MNPMTGLYSIEDLREYITELYHYQRYTEREILTVLLDYGVQTEYVHSTILPVIHQYNNTHIVLISSDAISSFGN